MKHIALVFWVILLILVGVGYAARMLWKADEQADPHTAAAPRVPAFTTGLSQTPGGELADFTLIDSAGKEFHLHESAGRVRAVSFFFTACPSICFQLNNTLAKLQGEQPGEDVLFISITCDPKNDTPAQLTSYAARFAADPKRWAFLTGDMPTIEQVGLAMQVAVGREMHSDRVVLIDRQGRLRGNFRATEPGQFAQLKEALAKLVAEPYEAAADKKAAPAEAPTAQ